MNKHTPGPWTVSPDGQAPMVRWADTTNPIVSKVHGYDVPEAEANAKLIAKAPDMRKFIAEFVDWWDEAGSFFYGPGCKDEDEGLQGIATDAEALLESLPEEKRS